jgi:hypothetical protein
MPASSWACWQSSQSTSTRLQQHVHCQVSNDTDQHAVADAAVADGTKLLGNAWYQLLPMRCVRNSSSSSSGTCNSNTTGFQQFSATCDGSKVARWALKRAMYCLCTRFFDMLQVS